MNPVKRGNALFAHFFHGAALPEEMARPRTEGFGRKATEGRVFNDAIAREAAAKMENAPVITVNYAHQCKCGNKWFSFGAFTKEVTERLEGEGSATFYKPCAQPAPGTKTSIKWKEVQESICIKCYGGPAEPELAPTDSSTPAQVILEQYRHKAREDVDAIREKALQESNKLYVHNAVKRVVAALPYGMEDAIPVLPELVNATKVASESE